MGEGCWVERRSYGKDSILSTLLWGGYYHVCCTDKVIETWDEYFVAQKQRCSFGATGFGVTQLRFRPCLLTAPTSATDEERKRVKRALWLRLLGSSAWPISSLLLFFTSRTIYFILGNPVEIHSTSCLR